MNRLTVLIESKLYDMILLILTKKGNYDNYDTDRSNTIF